MKLVRYTADRTTAPGVKSDGKILDVSDTLPGESKATYSDVLGAAASDPEDLVVAAESARENGAEHEIEDVDIEHPVSQEGRLICLGGMYTSHLDEAGLQLNRAPNQWVVPERSIVGPGDTIRIPERCKENVRPAIELGVVIGTGGRNIPQTSAGEHVAGYTIVNDVTARTDWPGSMGYKLIDTFNPCGEFVTTPDEISDRYDLEMRIEQDGWTICEGNTSGLRFTLSFAISFVSTVLELRPGDVISTGDPGGVETSLNLGTEVTLEIESLGVLTNPVETVD